MCETKTCINCTHDKEPNHLRPCPDCYRRGVLQKFSPIKKPAIQKAPIPR